MPPPCVSAISTRAPAGGSPSARRKARASGCEECASAAATSGLTASSPCQRTSVARPSVSVPVLSSNMRPGRASFSSASPPLIRMPARAARPMATLTASGVASASAHGQVTISSATAWSSARAGSTRAHSAKVIAASASTTATKRPAMRSASCTIGARRRACSLHQRHQPADPGLLAGALDPDLEPRGQVERAGVDRVARRARTGARLAREQREVDASERPADDHAVGRHHVARAHLDEHAGRRAPRAAPRAPRPSSSSRAEVGESEAASSAASAAARCCRCCR